MPALHLTISLWWLVAIVAQLAWIFGPARLITGWIRNQRWARVGTTVNTHEWVYALSAFIAGPLAWAIWIWDETEAWNRRRKRDE